MVPFERRIFHPSLVRCSNLRLATARPSKPTPRVTSVEGSGTEWLGGDQEPRALLVAYAGGVTPPIGSQRSPPEGPPKITLQLNMLMAGGGVQRAMIPPGTESFSKSIAQFMMLSDASVVTMNVSLTTKTPLVLVKLGAPAVEMKKSNDAGDTKLVVPANKGSLTVKLPSTEQTVGHDNPPTNVVNWLPV
jgi:hypothetical protein